MRRGWQVEYTDGSTMNEAQKSWREVPKVGITRLTLHYDGRRWDIHNKEAYLQKKRGSMIPAKPETFRIESRSIGYYEDDKKVWYTVNEFTGMMKMEVEDI